MFFIAINSESDHLHILFEAEPAIQLLNLINVIKTKTVRFARRDHIQELNKYYYKPYFWTDSYFVSTVGTNKKVIDEYINNQQHSPTPKSNRYGCGTLFNFIEKRYEKNNDVSLFSHT